MIRLRVWIIHLAVVLVLLFITLRCSVAARAAGGRGAQDASAASAYPIPGDRWLEIDLYWFEQNDIAGSVRAFWDRFQPLYQGTQGYRGLILNVGWTVSCIMEWSGDLSQRVSLPQGTGQQHWVDERGPLRGTTEQRMQEARARFAKPQVIPRHGYGPWTYGDLRKLVAAIRQEAAQRGLPGFRVGMLNYAWTNAYGETPGWVRRHPEAFTAYQGVPSGESPFSPYFDPNAKLHADSTKLGGLPRGIPEGIPVHRAYAAQWGSMSKAVGLDALMLRDTFGFPVPYRRGGPWGPVAPSPEVIREATAGVAALVREVKTANPQALVMMYSNAASAVGDWRANGLDLESIAKQGYLDIFVDQTWAGAWNEVGLRETDFWNNPLLGWTYQLGYMLLHSAILADTKVRHYPLIETFDAWEDWDVIHTAPERLRWGIWAYSHAAVKTPQGLKLPAGSYISWANQGKRLLSQDDIRFLKDNLNAAIADARSTREVLGPTLAYSRESMEWQIAHAMPHHDVKEWIDEQAASVMKWPIPILSVTRVEWLPSVKSDLFILQAPSHLSPEHAAYIEKLIREGQPMAIFGSPKGGIDPEIARLGGLSATAGRSEEQSTIHMAKLSDPTQTFALHVPEFFKTYYRLSSNQAGANAHLVYTVDGNPVLTLNTAQGKRVVMWDPPDVMFKGDTPLLDLWGGSAAPYALVAGVLNSLLANNNDLHAEQVDLSQTMNITAWEGAGGIIYILAGNLEEGLRSDADMTRHSVIGLPASWKIKKWANEWSQQDFGAEGGRLKINLEQAGSVLLHSVTD
jgi:hypothetical protein